MWKYCITVFLLLVLLGVPSLAQDTNSQADLNSSADANAVADSNVVDSNVFEQQSQEFTTKAQQIAQNTSIALDKLIPQIVAGVFDFLNFVTSGTDAIVYTIIMSLVFYWVLGNVPVMSRFKKIRLPLAVFLSFATASVLFGIVRPVLTQFLGGA